MKSDELKYLEKDVDYWEIQLMVDATDSNNLRGLMMAKTKLSEHLQTLRDKESGNGFVSKFKLMESKRHWTTDWCPRCAGHYKMFCSWLDKAACADNTACTECGLKKEPYIDELGGKDVRWPEEYANVEQLCHPDEIYLYEDYVRDHGGGNDD